MGFRTTAKQRMTDASQGVLDLLFRYAKRVPYVRQRIEAEYDKILQELRAGAQPYRDEVPTWRELPDRGRDRETILAEMERLRAREDGQWQNGYVSGAVYHGDPEHIAFLDRVYALNSQTNPLHSDLWPRITKYEAEVVSMTAHMLGASHTSPSEGDDVCGVVTSGGTESIMLAMKTYRDWGRARRGITTPEMVVPITAHAAFDKAAESFGIKPIKIAIGSDMRVDAQAVKRAIGRNTVVVVGSAPGFPHGVIDPIEELSETARQRGVGFHTDACLGGFVLPWARELGYPVPQFDFRLPGVTSMSADTHKYGYAAKGTSVVLYRNRELRRHQFYTATDWPGGLYMSPTFAGSRPGALSASCWAAMLSMGAEGYKDATRKILDTAAHIRAGIEAIEGVQVLGQPLWVIAFASEALDVYRIMDFMAKRHWNLNGLHRPACIHLCVTLRHTTPGVAERFLADLRAAVEHVRATPREAGGMAPVYGMAATLPVRGAVSDLLRAYLDVLYEA
jgi:glutamate/tyrosine decarboxylase-like PLP-dependent enzyme